MLNPTTSLEYLGFRVDSVKQCFQVPKRKIDSWASLRESILACKKSVDVKTLQRFQGKCISFSLAVPAAKLFIREISSGIASATASGLVQISPSLREELRQWRFLDTWQECMPWRDERHFNLSISTDASGFGWGGIVHMPLSDQKVGDYWSEQQRQLNISTKEMLALVNTVKALPACIKDCRLDAFVDSKVLIGAWEGQGSRSAQLTKATKELFWVLSDRNLQLCLSYVRSSDNLADDPSRRLSRMDSGLSKKAWSTVQRSFGGRVGHSIDLMALDSNSVTGKDGLPLPHFSPWPTPYSQGVNLFAQDLHLAENMENPYVFPPFILIGPVLKFLYKFKVSFTVVVPEIRPYPFWWPELMARTQSRVVLGAKGSLDVILAPTRCGFEPMACPFTLWACRVLF